MRRRLTVKNDTVLYQIHDYNGMLAATRGIFGDYLLKLKKHSGSLYKAKNKEIKLNIKVLHSDTATVEVVKGTITFFYSGGLYFEETVDFPPEKQILTFVRELTAEDGEKFKKK
jgi:hypothetical protein